jgi:CRISPR/Cas system-associated endonuclease Cas3-HD
MNSKAIKELINDYKALFWYIPENKKENLGEDQVVETILNYGDEKAIHRLIEIMGIDKVAQIFNKQISMSSRRKNNYHELVSNYFQLYFKRHATGNTNR